MDQRPLSVFVVGSRKAGKSAISNLLYGFDTSEYRPTQGVRVLELERTLQSRKVAVQLWDWSGDSNILSVVGPLASQVDGVIFVASGDGAGKTDLRELEAWFAAFPNINEERAFVLVQRMSESSVVPKVRNNGALAKLRVLHTYFGEVEQLKKEFDGFLSKLITSKAL